MIYYSSHLLKGSINKYLCSCLCSMCFISRTPVSTNDVIENQHVLNSLLRGTGTCVTECLILMGFPELLLGGSQIHLLEVQDFVYSVV